MKITGIVIEPDGSTRTLEMEQTESLRALQEAVGGYIERVSSADETVDLWCNEEGKLEGLPFNWPATALLYDLNPAFRGQDVLCGAVVVTGGSDGKGESLSIPDGVDLDNLGRRGRMLAAQFVAGKIRQRGYVDD